MKACRTPELGFETLSGLLARNILDAWRSADMVYLREALEGTIDSIAHERESRIDSYSSEESERLEVVESLAEQMRSAFVEHAQGLSTPRVSIWKSLLNHLSAGRTQSAALMAVN